MRITERLNVEHGVFLNLLQQVDDRLGEGRTDEAIAIAKAVIRAFGAHCQLEDRLLYPALAGVVSADIAPLRRMEADHRELAELSDAILYGPTPSGLLETFVTFVREHIEREIHVLSPLIEELVPQDQLTALCDWSGDHIRERAGRSHRGSPAE